MQTLLRDWLGLSAYLGGMVSPWFRHFLFLLILLFPKFSLSQTTSFLFGWGPTTEQLLAGANIPNEI